jgi:hypothetical protein
MDFYEEASGYKIAPEFKSTDGEINNLIPENLKPFKTGMQGYIEPADFQYTKPGLQK